MKYNDYNDNNQNLYDNSGEWDEAYDRGFADKLYEEEYEEEEQGFTEQPAGYMPPDRKKKKKHHWGRGILIALLVLVLLVGSVAAFLCIYPAPPEPQMEKPHKGNVSTILIAGTDESGLRTDTLMLLCANRETKRLSVMSIPRDTKVNSTYYPQKINLAYHMNHTGEEGMYWLMDYVRQCVGFRPDGYILVDLDCFQELVDVMGGVKFDVPCEMHYEDPSQDLYIDLKPGLQKLNGKDAMGLVRFRSGYAMADLERVSVQRNFIMAAAKQWAKPHNVIKLPKALKILSENSLTDLSSRNCLWFAWSVLVCGTDDMELTTIPYYLSGDYVCIDADEEYLELINQYFNPYEENIGFDDLNIAH